MKKKSIIKTLILFISVILMVLLIGTPRISQLFTKASNQQIKLATSIKKTTELVYQENGLYRLPIRRPLKIIAVQLLDPKTLTPLNLQSEIASLVASKAQLGNIKYFDNHLLIPLEQNKQKISTVKVTKFGEVSLLRANQAASETVLFSPKYFNEPEIFWHPHLITVSKTIKKDAVVIKRLSSVRPQVLVKIAKNSYLINLQPKTQTRQSFADNKVVYLPLGDHNELGITAG
jgi:hypothetical protein